MPEIPDCLSHRYRALDELIKELSQNSVLDSPGEVNSAGIKLMCDFWNILKEDPDCNLTQEVRMRMGITPTPAVEARQGVFGIQRYMAYMAGTDDEGPPKKSCCESESEPKKKTPKEKKVCCSSKSDDLPLTKVLCNLDEASDFDQKCHVRVKNLQKAQDELSAQIGILESREKDGVELLKKADAIWMTMENAYKEKLSQSAERQKELIKQLKEVEVSSKKWRKNRKDLEFQIQNMNKAKIEIAEKTNQKKNDLKIMESDIANLEKRIDSNRKDLDNSRNSMGSKREKSDSKLSQLANEIAMAQKKTREERVHKKNKIEEGTQYVREAREDLQKICKTYLQKKLENEDLIAEKKALQEEMALLKTTAEACKEKCQKKALGVNEEIKKLTAEIAAFEVKCIQCHVCTDTNDSRKICTDCPRCAKSDCIIKDGYCTSDPAMDCVCMSVKQKFLDNVFENMYTVLARQSKTRPGKAAANAVIKCLRKSRNGKLDQDTRNMLQEFILNTVKRNLNLTIVGGAVKTRCEMEPETYKQLMLCLKNVKAVAKKEDKGTVAKKDACKRWGDETECHCPKGPKDCVCMKKAPRPPNDPTPCPDEVMGPIDDRPEHEGRPCDMSGWRRAPCAGASCSYAKNMRAAQCVLGPKKLNQPCAGFNVIDDISEVDDLVDCNCRKRSCSYCQDMCGHPRQRMIEEVMGRIDEVEPVSKVDSMRRQRRIQRNISRSDATCDCSLMSGNSECSFLLMKSRCQCSFSSVKPQCTCSTSLPKQFRPKATSCKNNNKGCDCSSYLNISRKQTDKKRNNNLYRNSQRSKGVNVFTNIKLFPKYQNSNSQLKKKNSDDNINVILFPKFSKFNDDKNASLVTNKRLSSYTRLNSKTSLNDNKGINARVIVSDIDKNKINDNNLIKDFDSEELNYKTDSSSIENLLQELTTLPKTEYRNNDTASEKEVKCETLEAVKSNNRLQSKWDTENEVFAQNKMSQLVETNRPTSSESNDVKTNTDTGLKYYDINEDKSKKKHICQKIIEVDPSVVKTINVKTTKDIKKCLRDAEIKIKQTPDCNCRQNKGVCDEVIKSKLKSMKLGKKKKEKKEETKNLYQKGSTKKFK